MYSTMRFGHCASGESSQQTVGTVPIGIVTIVPKIAVGSVVERVATCDGCKELVRGGREEGGNKRREAINGAEWQSRQVTLPHLRYCVS